MEGMAQLRAVVSVVLTLCLASCRTAWSFSPSDWTLPRGFSVDLYFPGDVPKARQLALSGASAATGPWITYVSGLNFAPDPVSIHALVDLKGAGVADYKVTIVSNLSSMPTGIAWHGGALYIASLDPYKSCTLFRLDNADQYALKRETAKLSDLKVVLDSLPIDMWHGWKFIRFGPDGKLYIPIGANCNACRLDGDPPNNGYVDGKLIYTTENSLNPFYQHSPYQKNANSPVWQFGSIYRMDPDGNNIELFAKGVRNTVGFDWHPDTKALYFTDNGRDDWGGTNSSLTDNNPDCELNYAPESGLDYGFPFCHTGPAGNNPDANPYLRKRGRGLNLQDPDLNADGTAMACNGPGRKFRPAIQAMGPHVAPLGMQFYKWDPKAVAQFPKAYDRSILVAQRGSWNRNRPIGARVMRVVLGKPGRVSKYAPLMSGGVPGDIGLPDGPDPPVAVGATYKGRPVDVEQLPDGSVLVSDDFSSKVYRITYNGASRCHVKGSGCGYGTDAPLLPAEAVQGTRKGCRINMGDGQATPRYRRCVRLDMSGQRDFLTLAYSLRRVDGRLVMDGALLGQDYASLNGEGWMAVGVHKGGMVVMGMSNAILARPLASGGTSVKDYYLGGYSFNFFSPTENFLEGSKGLQAAVAGDALVATFSIYLTQSAGSSVKIIFALGDVASDGTPQQHWTTAAAEITLREADVGAKVPKDVPILNTRGMRFSSSPPPSPSPSPPPESPPPSSCTLEGVAYDGCTETSDAGLPVTLYFTKAGDTLKGAIKADVKDLGSSGGWATLAYIPTPRGGMIGADALIVSTCSSCDSGIKAEAYYLDGYSTTSFIQPTSAVTFSDVSPSLLASGELLATFSVDWKAGANGKMQVRYGGGPVGSTGALFKHLEYPALACVTASGGLTSVGSGC